MTIIRTWCAAIIVLQGASATLAAPVSDAPFWYHSGVTSDTEGRLKLSARLNYDDARAAAPIAVVMHWFGGDGGDVTNNAQRLRDQGFFAISVAMRGRSGSAGVRDDGGLEIYDIYDAVEAVKAQYADRVDPTTVYITGYSGGGGNVMSALTKFPDYFRVGAAFYGISDYGYDAKNGFWGTSPGDQPQLTFDIGDRASEDPAVQDRYMARASNLASRNNSYSEIHLFVNDNEDRCAPIHDTSYCDNAVAVATSPGEFNNIHVHVGNNAKPEYIDFNANGQNDPNERQDWPHGIPDSDQQHAAEAWFLPRLLDGRIARPQLKSGGKLFVAGFVKTRPFTCWLGDGQNAAALLTYSLAADRKEFALSLLSHDKSIVAWLEVDTWDMAGRRVETWLDGARVGQFTGGGLYRYENLEHAEILTLLAMPEPETTRLGAGRSVDILAAANR